MLVLHEQVIDTIKAIPDPGLDSKGNGGRMMPRTAKKLAGVSIVDDGSS